MGVPSGYDGNLNKTTLDVNETASISFLHIIENDDLGGSLTFSATVQATLDDGGQRTISKTSPEITVKTEKLITAYVTVTISNVDTDGNPKNTQGLETYVRLFEDEAITQAIGEPEKITFDSNTSKATKTLEFKIRPGNYYLAQTSKEGIPLTQLIFNGEIAIVPRGVNLSLNEDGTNLKVTFTNSFIV